MSLNIIKFHFTHTIILVHLNRRAVRLSCWILPFTHHTLNGSDVVSFKACKFIKNFGFFFTIQLIIVNFNALLRFICFEFLICIKNFKIMADISYEVEKVVGKRFHHGRVSKFI